MNSIESLSPRLLQSLIEAASTGIVITDAMQKDNPIIFANDAFFIMTGYTPAETIGFNCRFLQGDDAQQKEIQVLRNAVKTGSHCKVVLRNYKKDGTRFWNELYVSPYFDELGRLSNFIGIQHDVTEAVEQRSTNNLLTSAAAEAVMPLQAQSRVLEYFDVHSRTFAGHSEETRKLSTTLSVSITQVLDVLNLHKLDNQLLMPRLEAVQASELMQAAVGELRALASAKEIEINVAQLGGDYHFLADRMMCRHALKNLVEVAVNYSQPGKAIWITSLANELATMIAVVDEASGLPSAIKQQTLDSHAIRRDDFYGTSIIGPGIKTAAQIMKVHGGELNLIKSDYRGTEFALVFPRQTQKIINQQTQIVNSAQEALR